MVFSCCMLLLELDAHIDVTEIRVGHDCALRHIHLFLDLRRNRFAHFLQELIQFIAACRIALASVVHCLVWCLTLLRCLAVRETGHKTDSCPENGIRCAGGKRCRTAYAVGLNELDMDAQALADLGEDGGIKACKRAIRGREPVTATLIVLLPLFSNWIGSRLTLSI